MEDEYYIWSIENQAWWKAGWAGYATDIRAAGTYDRTQANAVLEDANLVRTEEVKIPVSATGLYSINLHKDLELYLIWNLLKSEWKNFNQYYPGIKMAGLYSIKNGKNILRTSNAERTTEVLIPLSHVITEDENGSKIPVTS